MKKLLILDSNSIINRAFYGIRMLNAKDGTPTNAVYGFCNILFKLIEEVQPDYLCAAFDVHAPTFRHLQYAEYKAQRKPMPEDLKKQMPIAKNLLRAMHIPVIEKEGYEADDVIGTVSKRCEEQGIACYIATGDKDDLQLASDKTQVILTVTRSGVNETVYYDDQAVLEKYHVTPTEFIDVKALMGDPSDNIPGVAGVGEKTAMSLIEQHKSIEYIYDHIDEIGLKGAMLEKMKKGREMAFLSKELATIDRNVPMEFQPEICAFEGGLSHCATEEAHALLKTYSLNSIIKRLDFSPQAVQAAKTNLLEGIQIEQITALKQLAAFLETVEKAGQCVCVFDFAGDRLSRCGLLCGATAAAVAVAELGADAVLEQLAPMLENEKIEKITFDIKETLVHLAGRCSIQNIAYDAAIAAYLIDPARQAYTIDGLAADYLGAELREEQTQQLSLFDAETVSDFAARQAVAVWRLYGLTKQKIEELGQQQLYYDVELPLVRVLADMQIYGIRIDRERLAEFSRMLAGQIETLTAEIYQDAGEEFNINSPKQLGAVLFEKLGLKAGKKTKTGYSTNIEVLEKLRGAHPIVERIIEYRQLAKLKSTYCDGLAAVIHPATGRIHSVFNQTVTVTGRISSIEPNMQNIPVRTELGRELRKMFVAANADHVLIDADYSQIELRVLADIAADETMLRAFETGEDIHAVTASQVLGVPLEDVTPEQRSSAKAVNFGIVYGIGEFSLAKDLHISVKEARQYIEGYLEKYHGVREYMENIKRQAAQDGYVKTMLHRIRYIPELKSTNHNVRAFGERVALNTPIQGSAADIIKLAMVRVHRRLAAEGLEARLILQVHDELILEAPKAEIETASKILKEEMEHAVSLRAPLVADTAYGYSWYDAK